MRLLSLSSKSVFATGFACANLAVIIVAAKLLNSGIMTMIIKFFSIPGIFCYFLFFLTKLLTSGILFSTSVNAEFVAKTPILGILFSISVVLAL